MFKIDPPKVKNDKTIFMNGLEYDNIISLNDLARKGIASKLIGGNLTLVHSTFSTKYEPE